MGRDQALKDRQDAERQADHDKRQRRFGNVPAPVQEDVKETKTSGKKKSAAEKTPETTEE